MGICSSADTVDQVDAAAAAATTAGEATGAQLPHYVTDAEKDEASTDEARSEKMLERKSTI